MTERDFNRITADFLWNVVEIQSQLDDIHTSLAVVIGVTEPQWLFLMAVSELEEGRGVAGVDIAKKLHVHPAFVTTQSKNLEKGGFLWRRPAAEDARFILMSLTPNATAEIGKLSSAGSR